MLNKMGGIWAPNPKSGPHKKNESFPLILILRNKLKNALNNREVTQILQQKIIKIDGKIRIEKTYPTGIMDVISIERTKENFRILYDTNGRFILHRIEKKESLFKICKVEKQLKGKKGIPFIVTHDGRTIRYPDPSIKVHDSIIFNLSERKIIDFIKFNIGALSLVIGGKNIGRIGIILYKEHHKGSIEIVRIKDINGLEFATKISNVFIIGKGNKSFISLPKTKGLKK
mmetsp:Transcript_15664/g.32225  ORF Transcript_15664/g.32225 Transcript_15664/m.32225 type:complete len:229 (+) Transcript_15664:93-779(+)